MTHERLDKNYELIEKLGYGGMAEVWLARGISPDAVKRDLAIKRVRRDLRNDAMVVAWFRQEAQLTSSLNHANIVHVKDTRVRSDDPYFVMDFIEGVTLSQLSNKLRDDGETLALDIIIYIVDQVLSALEYIHKHEYCNIEGEKQSGVIHRDISPQNIMLSISGHVKVTDFGIARGEDEETAAVFNKGKRRYMPPEQFPGSKQVSSAVDIFALGAVLQELLGRRELGSLALELEHLPPTLAHADQLPPELDALRSAMLDPDHRRRPSAKAARDRLSVLGVSTRSATRLGELVTQIYTRTRPVPMLAAAPSPEPGRDGEQTGSDAIAAMSLSTDAGQRTPDEEEDTANSVSRVAAILAKQDNAGSGRAVLVGAGLAMLVVFMFLGTAWYNELWDVNDGGEDLARPAMTPIDFTRGVTTGKQRMPSPPPASEAPASQPPPDPPTTAPEQSDDEQAQGLPVEPVPVEPPQPKRHKVSRKSAKPTPQQLAAHSLPACSKQETRDIEYRIEVRKDCNIVGTFEVSANGELRSRSGTIAVPKPAQACIVTLESACK